MILKLLLVTDTNIWIDIDNGYLLDFVFNLPFNFIIPDFASLELFPRLWSTLILNEIQIYQSSPDQINEIIQFKQRHPGLSITDLAAFVLARDLHAILLSGDDPLRRLAQRNLIEVHGVLWILDELVDRNILPAIQAANALEKMLAKNARLPQDECRKRLNQWQSNP